MTLNDFLEGKPTDEEKAEHMLLITWAWCDHFDKSTEYMLSFMSMMSGVEYDEVVDFVVSPDAQQKRDEFYKTYPNWLTELEEIGMEEETNG